MGERLNQAAVFSDETKLFRLPLEPKAADCVTVRVRTAHRDAERVYLLWEDTEKMLQTAWNDGMFDYYEGVLPPTQKTISYRFRIEKGNEIYYYSKAGLTTEPLLYADFLVIRDFHTPDWSKGCLMYQIYVDRFCNGDEKNDVQEREYWYLDHPAHRQEDWQAMPQEPDYATFYGGDLAGVIKKLPYLHRLGVEAIYLNPIFVSPSNHKYDTQDYDHVDPHFGKIPLDGGECLPPGVKDNTQATKYIARTTRPENLDASDGACCELVEQAHALGIRVILDGVFNHCGAFHRWMDREGLYYDGPPGAYQSEQSPYHEYFLWDPVGVFPDNYEGWWGFPNHPKLNYEGSEKLMQAIMAVGQRWVSPPFSADGWRVDVAADLGQSPEMNHRFWRQFRQSVKTVSPETLLLAEHYGDPSSWLTGDQWDTVMNYDAFMEPVSYFLTGMEKHSDAFRPDLLNQGQIFAQTMIQHMMRLPQQALFTAMNQLSNHDHSRFLTRTNQTVGRLAQWGSKRAGENVNVAVMREAVLLQMTWVGAPTIYYGDEAGLCGFTDPDNRRPFPWGMEDISLIEYHHDLIRLRKEHSALRCGSTMFLVEGYGLLAYGRFDQEEKLAVALNNLDMAQSIVIPVWRMGVREGRSMSKLYVTYETGFGYSGERHIVQQGCVSIQLPPRSGVILKYETVI